ncbi:MAG: lytic transglycosylase domain-containing protein [Xanthomonadales bacterium]|nr:lytic transglycosylase domain-containing protein [Xanthomonadales bacterium]
MRGILVAVSLLAAAPSALAEGIYRCRGARGEVAYTSDPERFRDCRAITVEAPQPASRRGAAAPAGTGRRDGAATRGEGGTGAQGNGQRAAAAERRGAIYKFRRNGITHYTNIRPRHGGYEVVLTYIERCYACGLRSRIDWSSVPLDRESFAAEIAEAAQRHGVDEALVRAVMHAESNFRPGARSHKGAQGLMQLMPATAEALGVRDPFDPRENIEGGVAYLKQMLERFGGDERLAVAAYNAGPEAVERHGGVPPFAETRVYVERVAQLRRRYASE